MNGRWGAVLLAAAVVGCGGHKPLARGDGSAATTDGPPADLHASFEDAGNRDRPDGDAGDDGDTPEAGVEPTTFVAAAPGCIAMRVLHEAGQITWLDAGHGTVKRIPAGGGPIETLASALKLALVHPHPEGLQNGERYAMRAVATVVVREGTVYFVGAEDAPGEAPALTCDASADGGVTCRPDPTHILITGGGGVSIHSVDSGSAPRTLLPAALVPQVSEQVPNINAIALSPDGKVLFFNAGSGFYRIPSAGATTAADVQLVGVTGHPDRDVPTTLVTDGRRLFYPAMNDEWIETFDSVTGCDAESFANQTCPRRVVAHVRLLYDTLMLRGGDFYCAKENTVLGTDVGSAPPPWPSPDTYAFSDGPVTGFAVGSTRIYAGLSRTQYGGDGLDGLIERIDLSPTDDDTRRVLARGQKQPSSLAVDGTNVYWTTTNCDIMRFADSPQ